jgi:PAS domain S-box-containing protein
MMRATRISEGTLRRRAEKRLAEQHAQVGPAPTGVDLARLAHELEVHRIELELQNEDLRQAKDDIEQSYNELFDCAPVGYFTLDSTGVIHKANTTAANMLGRERAQLLGKRLLDFIDPESRDTFNVFMLRLSSGRGKQSSMLTLARLDGARLYTVTEASPTKEGYRAVLLDITTIRQADLARRYCEERLKLAAEAAKLGVWEWDFASRRMFLAPECYPIFGTEQSSITLDTLKSLVHPEDRGRFLALLELNEGSKASRSLEFRLVRPEGEIAIVHALCKIQHDLNGKASGVVGTIRDITPAKRNDEALRLARSDNEGMRGRPAAA